MREIEQVQGGVREIRKGKVGSQEATIMKLIQPLQRAACLRNEWWKRREEARGNHGNSKIQNLHGLF